MSTEPRTTEEHLTRIELSLTCRISAAHGLESLAALRAQIAEMEADCAKFRKWANCCGVPAGRTCSVDGHEIYGPFMTEGPDFDSPATCELHFYQATVTKLVDQIAEMERKKGSPSIHSHAPESAANRESDASLLPLIRAAIDGYHHVAHCVDCGEMSVDYCTEGRQAQEAIAALEAALPNPESHQEDAPASNDLPKGTP